MEIEQAYTFLYSIALVVLALLIGLAMYRTIKGPRITDRLVAVNMIGTMVVCSIAILSGLLDESWLLDVALVYVMISFLSVIILASVYIRKVRMEDAGEAKSGQKEEEKV